MALLLDQRGDEVKITEEVVKAAAKNEDSGKEVIALLLNQRGDDSRVDVIHDGRHSGKPYPFPGIKRGSASRFRRASLSETRGPPYRLTRPGKRS